MTREDLILEGIKDLKSDVHDIKKAIYGNGGPGMQERIRDNGQRIELIEERVNEKKDMNIWFKRLVAGAVITALISQIFVYVRIASSDRSKPYNPDRPARIERNK